VLDMSGNVWEWCLNEYSQPEKVALSGNAYRVVRGGSWFDVRDFARASHRYFDDPDYRYFNFGFRVVVRPPSL